MFCFVAFELQHKTALALIKGVVVKGMFFAFVLMRTGHLNE